MQRSPIASTPNTNEIIKQMEKDEFVGEINDKDIVLEILKFSTIPLLQMTENLQEDIEMYRWVVKINGIAIACDVFDVPEKEIVLEAINHRE